MTFKTTWLVHGDDGYVCRVFLSFSSPLDRFVCSTLYNGRVNHHTGQTREDALKIAREFVEERFGKIVGERPDAPANQVRIARWTGVPMLVVGDKAIQIDDDLVVALASKAGSELTGFLTRRILPTLQSDQQDLLRGWLAQHTFDAVPLDALFAAAYPSEDWWPE